MNPPSQMQSRDVAQQLEATSQAAVAAHDAHLREATDSVRWDRRGWLARLTRVERSDHRA
jgi:hypothetical protein